MIGRRLAVVAVLLLPVSWASGSTDSPVKILGPEVGQRFRHTLAAMGPGRQAAVAQVPDGRERSGGVLRAFR